MLAAVIFTTIRFSCLHQVFREEKTQWDHRPGSSGGGRLPGRLQAVGLPELPVARESVAEILVMTQIPGALLPEDVEDERESTERK